MSDEVKVIRSSSAPSLSGKGTISYEIGTMGDSQYIRLSGNSGGGLFCKDWVALADIQQLLAGKGKITSKLLKPLYEGRSSNNFGFFLACVLQEKIAAEPLPKKPAKGKKDEGSP